jgi:WD40 repeat protein
MEPVAAKKAEFDERFSVFSLAFSPDGTHIATSSPNSKEVHIWTWQSNSQLIETLHQGEGGGGSINGLRYSPDGTFLASAHGADQQDRILRIWSAKTGAVVGDVAERFGGAGTLGYAALEFSPDGQFLIRSQRGWHMEGQGKVQEQVFVDSFIVYDTATWQRVWALKTEPVSPSALAVSRNGRYAAIAGDERLERNGAPFLQSKVLIVDLGQRQLKQSVNIPSDYMNFVAWSSDGRRIVVGGNALEILDANAGTQLLVQPTTAGIVGVTYSPDGKYLVVGETDGVGIWDSGHTKLLQRISGKLVTAVTISRDGRYLAIARDHNVGIWEVK